MFINTLRPIRIAQRGDTIVEVLISVAVASLMLAGAYAITNHNVITQQDTQEHNQAQQLVQSQIELLHSDKGSSVVPTPTPTCYKPTGVPATLATDCKVNASDVPSTVEPVYTLSISVPPMSSVYTISATWKSLQGGTASVIMEYAL